MQKEITCRHCDGSGKETISICDVCQEESLTGIMTDGKYKGKMLCQNC